VKVKHFSNGFPHKNYDGKIKLSAVTKIIFWKINVIPGILCPSCLADLGQSDLF
jgi:hypothetical protein